MEKPLTSVIIPRQGMGRRMNAVSKQYLQLNGKPILAHTLDAFEKCPLIDEIILVINPEGAAALSSRSLRPIPILRSK